MKKLGVFLPSRPELRRVTRDMPGIFLESVADAVLRGLRGKFRVVEGLDFRKASVVDGEVWFGGTAASGLDAYFWFSQVDKGSDGHDILVLEQLERRMPVMNPSAGLKIGLDKFKTSSLLKANGVPVPEFALIEAGDDGGARRIFERWGTVLAKPRFGGFGIGIFRTGDPDEFLDLVDFAGLDCAYVERYYENDMSAWCGVNVVGGRVLHGYGKKGGAIRGYKVLDRGAKGGKMVERKPDARQEEIALKVGEITGLDFFGVDIIKAMDGRHLVVDVNTFPGIYPEMCAPARIAAEFVGAVRARLGG